MIPILRKQRPGSSGPTDLRNAEKHFHFYCVAMRRIRWCARKQCRDRSVLSLLKPPHVNTAVKSNKVTFRADLHLNVYNKGSIRTDCGHSHILRRVSLFLLAYSLFVSDWRDLPSAMISQKIFDRQCWFNSGGWVLIIILMNQLLIY